MPGAAGQGQPVFERYAIYHVPSGPLARAGAAWLGWDVRAGGPVAQPDIASVDLAALTATPRKYGFHGTIKPPFHLARGTSQTQLRDSLAALAAQTQAVTLDGLQVARMGRFLALTPIGDQDDLRALAATVVRALDRFRAPPTAEETARRRPHLLFVIQRQNLQDWGYPHVMDQFRFHITLTGRSAKAENTLAPATAYFAPLLPEPYVLNRLSLVGQRADGMFQEIEAFDLPDIP